MTNIEIFAVYVAVLALIQIYLTFRVISVRRREKISLGDSENSNLRKRIRGHGNFIETVPMALLGLLALALMNAPSLWLFVFGTLLVIGRLLHAYGIMQKNAVGPGRPLGMVITVTAILGEALAILYFAFT